VSPADTGGGFFQRESHYLQPAFGQKPDTSPYAMFSITDFLPTFADIVGGKMPTDRAIDGMVQTDVLTDVSARGHRDGRLPEGRQHRDGPSRGPHRRSTIWLGFGSCT
jgi:hypothetical protein